MNNNIPVKKKIYFYTLYISFSTLFTMVLNVIHTRYILHIEISAISFSIPLVVGVIFGSQLAYIKILSQQLKQLAFTDSLTKIYNRLHFAHFLDAEIDKVKRYGGRFSIIFFDIDHFKAVNDKFGHLVGDEVLEEITEVVSLANRSADIFARYGGEEFIILTPQTSADGAMVHAERLRSAIEKHSFRKIGNLTSSFGVAEFNPEKDTIETLLDRADKALYIAKEDGRNRVERA